MFSTGAVLGTSSQQEISVLSQRYSANDTQPASTANSATVVGRLWVPECLCVSMGVDRFLRVFMGVMDAYRYLLVSWVSMGVYGFPGVCRCL